ncbi:hypothetical protein TSUD_122530 [Trifolium subterraneum]|nr:hypothetical protein TSUD_122530 [Trifolium subterraneum]
MAKKYENLESELQSLLREEEAPFPLEHLNKDEVPLLLKFISTNRERITLPTVKNAEPFCWSLTYLISLLILLRDNSLLDIINVLPSDVIQIIISLRGFKFGGSWFDSLESILADNVQNNMSYLIIMEARERKLKRDYNYACHQLQMYRDHLENTDLNLTSEQTDSVHDRIKFFEQQREEFEPGLANIMEQLKVIYDARKSLNFFYPI